MTDALTLSQILSRGVPLEWHEGVAIVRGVMECLTTRGTTNVAPDLDQIQVLSSGQIEVTRGSKANEPVRRLGQLLHATIGNSDPPVKLRLVIADAMAPSPVYASFREYDQALEYFERPDRTAVLQALFARMAALPVSDDGHSGATLNTVAPLLSPSPAPTAAKSRPKRRIARLAAAAALVAAAIAWVEYGRTSAAVGLRPRDVFAAAQRVSSTVGSKLLSGLSALTQRAGMGRLVSQNGEATAVETPAQAETKPTTPSRTASAASSEPPSTPRSPAVEPASPRSSGIVEKSVAASAPAEAFPAPPPASTGDAVKVLAFDLEPNSRANPLVQDAIDRSPRAAAPVGQAVARQSQDLAVYSIESAGVEPPIAVRPQLPTELPPNMRRDSLIEVELIVSEAGRVDSVRLVGEARHMSDGMWLSAIKAWQFRPAVKGADAVKYRKTVWIAPLH